MNQKLLAKWGEFAWKYTQFSRNLMNMVKQHSCIPTKLLFRNNLFILLEQFPHVAGSNLLHCYQIFFKIHALSL